jgi:hypothetical protein
LGIARNQQAGNGNDQNGKRTTYRHGRSPFSARVEDPFLYRIDPRQFD